MRSLDELCIHFICENFKRFFLAFTVLKDENLKSSLVFLQRKYPKEFLSLLHKAGKLQEEYLDLLVTEYLTYFEDEWLGCTRYKSSMEEFFCRLPNLIKIIISSNSYNDEILKNVSRFCPEIIEIDAGCSNLTDIGLKYLYDSKNGTIKCPKLRKIDIIETSVSHEGVKQLIRNLPTLEILRWDNEKLLLSLYSIHNENLRKCNEIQYYNLIELCINLNFLHEFSFVCPDIFKVCLTVCPNLQDLTVSFPLIEELSAFAHNYLKKAKFCDLDRRMNMDWFLKMREWKKLTHLEIHNCTMSVSILRAHCLYLKEFKARNVNFTYNLKENFQYLTSCSFVDIYSKAICLFLSSSPKLESLIIWDIHLSPELKAGILLWCKNPCAKKIELSPINLIQEMEFVRKVLLNCPTLKEMFIANDIENGLYSEHYWEQKEILWRVAEALPNKPHINFF